MSSFVLKTIEMELTPASIRNAIKEVEKFRKDLMLALSRLVERLVEQGVEVAKMEIVSIGAVYDGDLYDSIYGTYNPETHIGTIYTDCEYAVYVEYGTGIRGENSPHPEPNGYQYDKNGHGADGWVYKGEDGQFHWTDGMPARPFMYNTLRELEIEAERRGGKLIAEYIP